MLPLLSFVVVSQLGDLEMSSRGKVTSVVSLTPITFNLEVAMLVSCVSVDDI